MRATVRHDRPPKPFGEGLGVAVFAARRHLRAAGHGVPSLIGPLDRCWHGTRPFVQSATGARPVQESSCRRRSLLRGPRAGLPLMEGSLKLKDERKQDAVLFPP